MTTMLIENHPLTQRKLQFICTSVNKLTLKSINIIQSSNNYNIGSSSICWNQNNVNMKILDTRGTKLQINKLSSAQKIIISLI